MGYVNKTISKDETLIKQAKICKLSFLDRYIAVALYIIAAVFALIDALVIKTEIAVTEQITLHLADVACALAGVVLLLLLVVLALYRGIQAIGKVEKNAALPGTVFLRLFILALLGIAVGAVGYMIGGTLAWVLNLVCGIVLAGLILLFAILRYKSIKLVLTDKRVFGRKNIWRTKSFDLPIDKADNVQVEFSFWGKMFNYATVTVSSVAWSYVIPYVKSGEEFKNLVMDFSAKYDGKPEKKAEDDENVA